MFSMRIVAALGALALAASTAFAVTAQERSSPVRPPAAGQIPAGSYQQSCNQITFDGATLRAQCATPSGARGRSFLAVRECRGGDIANIDGYLRCTRNTGPVPPTPPLPAGSYQQSCRGIELNGAILRAQCPNSRGAPVSSSIDTNSCRGRDIANDDGYLRCTATGPVAPLPPGSYQQSCRNAVLTGSTLRAQCPNSRGVLLAASIDVNSCRGRDIANNNGALRCTATGPVPPTPALPAGSYQQSCRGIELNGAILRAQCPNSRGAPVTSSIDVNSCRGRDIANDNGYLRCTATGPVPPTPALPAGSYQQSCRGIVLSGNVLRAQCTNNRGAPVSSSIDTNSCRGRDIYNDNGYLRCGNTGPTPPTPPQSNVQAMLYTGANYTGQMLIVNAPIADLATRRGFNDNVRSIRVVRGSAEICVDRQYRGRCMRTERSIADLNTISMGNRISSIR